MLPDCAGYHKTAGKLLQCSSNAKLDKTTHEQLFINLLFHVFPPLRAFPLLLVLMAVVLNLHHIFLIVIDGVHQVSLGFHYK